MKKTVRMCDLVGRPIAEVYDWFCREHHTAWGYTGWTSTGSEENWNSFCKFPTGEGVELFHDGKVVTKLLVFDWSGRLVASY